MDKERLENFKFSMGSAMEEVDQILKTPVGELPDLVKDLRISLQDASNAAVGVEEA